MEGRPEKKLTDLAVRMSVPIHARIRHLIFDQGNAARTQLNGVDIVLNDIQPFLQSNSKLSISKTL
jgi:hypothetical protein